MGETTCTPWRRYGHDRVYVARDGVRLGYLDRRTGAVVAEQGTPGELTAALAAGGWLDGPPAAPPPPAPPPLEPPPATFAITPRVPGARARAMAEQARAAAPIRTALARLLRVHTDERAWRVGADGEERVARLLARLGPEWTVSHDLPVGTNGANVDHLVAGPGGVVTLNTKNLSGDVWVGGTTLLVNAHRTDYVRNARHEAARVAKVLSRAVGAPVDVHGAVVVIAERLTVKALPDGVTVVGHRDLVRWLERRPVVLTGPALLAVDRAIAAWDG